jgi:hypothetical protein
MKTDIPSLAAGHHGYVAILGIGHKDYEEHGETFTNFFWYTHFFIVDCLAVALFKSTIPSLTSFGQHH